MVTTLWSATTAVAAAAAIIATATAGAGVEAFQLAPRKVVPAAVPAAMRPDRRTTSRSTAGATATTLRSAAAAASSDSSSATDTTPASSTSEATSDAASSSSSSTPSSSSSATATSSKAASYQNFDYTRQWYPVAFARDVPYDTPTQITLFDVDYVISRSSSSRSSSSTKQKDSSTKQQDKSAKQKDKRRVQGSESDDDELIYAVLDRCPHKSASLAEGRVVISSSSSCNGDGDGNGGDSAAKTAKTAATRFQCAYHGWSFDGHTGKCVDIPQVTASGGGIGGSSGGSRIGSGSKSGSGGGGKGGSVSSGGKSGSSGKSSSGGKSGKSSKSRADTTAIPALVQQGIIYLFPGSSGTPSPTTGTTTGTGTDPNLLQNALQTQPPPRIPELDLDGYRMIPQIRDFPIDWTILLENIMDPDHGLFAHQNVAFDLYSASGDCPIVVSEEFGGGGGGG
eukprot:CAMPEP_0178613594 /NCGR_PEP_ID=MMETSP0698-20121128/1726_1 /TAXON_ID=265572 /ORGANISM="Extubocellulus spinifer, Strain CCMP396" /LENGTH=452 /DNA_ID=CAMNT_0020252297 /DNA_START=57 /DNA_END=1412 /DNA_ORIENTATION=+